MDVDLILSLWESPTELARDLGLKPHAVRQWKYRRWIPPEHDFAIVVAARKRGKVVSLETIALIRASATPVSDTS